MARKGRGLGRGLDALIPRREEIERAMQIPDTTDVEVLFSDEEDAEEEHISKESFAGSIPGKQNIRSVNREEDPLKSIEDKSIENRDQEERHSEKQVRDQVRPQTEKAAEEEYKEKPPGVRSVQSGQQLQAEFQTELPAESEKEEDTEESAAAEGDVIRVRISRVEPNWDQPRKTFDEEKLEELAKSIGEYGILQPLLVQKRDDHYEIIAGERRWRAALRAGCKEVPVIVRDHSDKDVLALSLIENIQRENLNPIEEAAAYQRLIDEFGLRQEEVAQRVSKSRSAITNALRLLKLDERVQRMAVDGSLSMGHARALVPVQDSGKQYALAQRIKEEKLSVRETEREVKQLLLEEKEGVSARPKRDQTGSGDDLSVQLIYDEIQERLRQTLHTKVVIRRGRNGRGKLSIDFYNHDDLEKIIDRLSGGT